MATKAELSASLLKRFTGVPKVTEEDIDAWVERSMLKHGYNPDQEVPTSQTLLVLLFAEWDGCLQISLRAAHYFEYKDAEETVDKRQVAEQYRRLASELKNQYNDEKSEQRTSEGSSVFYIPTRADRN